MISAILILVFALPGLALASVFQSDNIRVAIVKGAESVELDGADLAVSDESGRRLDISRRVTVKKERDGIAVNGASSRKILAGAREFVIVNGKRYRNAVEIIPVGKGLVVVNELPMEDYLAGLINCEISSQWPIEAVKAQAVVARTYAVFQREARKNMLYHLESSVLDQVYEGCALEDSRAVRGVRETAGEVLTYKGKVIQAFFHSNCGGHTDAAENVWGAKLPYLQGVACKYCLESPSVAWEQTISAKRLEALINRAGYNVSGIRAILPLYRNNSGRIGDLSILFDRGSLNIPAVDFRKAAGYTVIKSTNFNVRVVGDDFIFSGVGYGHGVGLCQWGAKKRAEDGFNYREILMYYYPGTTLQKVD